ncbi:hypothetical protein BKA62DRAFT_755439 [Auriculariales sp. MPI-PUGE-AT-0066]|nr:hypothetical protein BKA62DRAFT_755439 [Auriculariales sp. MPI-PUGE-AT-0066]
MSTNNRITKVAIVGAAGNSGRDMAEALIASNRFVVTALTRASSNSTLPHGVQPVAVDYADKEALISALRGQDALVVTLAATAAPGTHQLLNEAAAAAGVPWILPNHWTSDTSNSVDPGLIKDVPAFGTLPPICEHIKSLGVSSFVEVSTGYWYEWSLAFADGFGFDFVTKKVTFYDDGETKMSLSTWPQVGRAVAALLSLPIKSEGGSCLEDYQNKSVYMNSFTVSQKDIFQSILRVTGDKPEDWKVEYESSADRYSNAAAAAAAEGGDYSALRRMFYARCFYPIPGLGNSEKHHGLINDAIGLKPDDIDEATRRGIERAQQLRSH